MKAISAIATARDVERSLDSVAREMAQACGMSFCIIFLLDQPKEHLIVAAMYSRNSKNMARYVGESHPLGAHPVSVATVTQRRRRVIESISNPKLSEVDRAYMQRREVKCLIDFPLASGEEVIGTLGLADVETERHFSEQELDLYQALTDSIATAIYNLKLLEDLNWRAAVMTMLSSIMQAANVTHDLKEMLQSSLASVAEFSGATGASIYLLDHSTDAPVASHGPSSAWLARALRSGSGEEALKRAVETGRPSSNNELVQDTLADLPRDKTSAFLSVIPIRAKKSVIGALCLISDSALEIRLVQALETAGDRLGVVIDNARLHEQTNKSVEDLTRLHLAASRLVSSLDQHQILDMALDDIYCYLASPDATVATALLETDGKSFRITSTRSSKQGLATETKLKLEKLASLHLAQILEQKPAFVSLNLASTPLLNKAFGAVGYCLLIPLTTHDRLLGLVMVIDRTRPKPTEHQARMLSTMAKQSSPAIENALIYAQGEERTRRLQELNNIKTGFLATVSHEFRTPLASLKTSVDLLQHSDKAAPGTDAASKLLGTMGRSIAKLERLISDLVDISALHTATLKLDVDQVDVSTVVASVTAMMSALVRDKEQTLEVDVDPGLPPLVADRHRLEQVLTNLLSNANKFSPKGARIRLVVTLDKGRMLFQVEDNGPGIPQDDLEKIFEPFYRVPNEVTRRTPGSGIGLSLAKQLVELHGGRIWVQSKQGEGSTFCLSLPAQETSASQ